MTNQETAQHFREYAQSSLNARWSWPTEGCGYRQHMKFMEYRNRNWQGGSKEELKQFLFGYADYLEHTPSITPIDKPGTSAEKRVEKLLEGDEYRRIIATGYNVPHSDVVEALVVTINEAEDAARVDEQESICSYMCRRCSEKKPLEYDWMGKGWRHNDGGVFFECDAHELRCIFDAIKRGERKWK